MEINNFKPISLLVFGLLSYSFIQAQESVNASSGNARGSGGSLAYSIGQMVYNTTKGSTGTITQGIQNPFEITSTGLKETLFTIELSAFPNPTSENLNLKINDFNKDELWYEIYDLQGKLVSTGQILSQQTQITTSNLPSTTYLIKVVNKQNRILQTFKVIKH